MFALACSVELCLFDHARGARSGFSPKRGSTISEAWNRCCVAPGSSSAEMVPLMYSTHPVARGCRQAAVGLFRAPAEGVAGFGRDPGDTPAKTKRGSVAIGSECDEVSGSMQNWRALTVDLLNAVQIASPCTRSGIKVGAKQTITFQPSPPDETCPESLKFARPSASSYHYNT